MPGSDMLKQCSSQKNVLLMGRDNRENHFGEPSLTTDTVKNCLKIFLPGKELSVHQKTKLDAHGDYFSF